MRNLETSLRWCPVSHIWMKTHCYLISTCSIRENCLTSPSSDVIPQSQSALKLIGYIYMTARVTSLNSQLAKNDPWQLDVPGNQNRSYPWHSNNISNLSFLSSMQQCPRFRPHYINHFLIPDRAMHVASCGCALGCGCASERFGLCRNDMHGAPTCRQTDRALVLFFFFYFKFSSMMVRNFNDWKKKHLMTVNQLFIQAAMEISSH